MAAIPIKDCVRVHSSSGTTGNPTVVLHSAKDLDQWANQVARCMYMVGLRDTDVSRIPPDMVCSPVVWDFNMAQKNSEH